MIIQIIPSLGGRPLRLDASQIVVMNDEGTPIAVLGAYGPDGAVKISHAGDADFNQTLRAFGHGQHTVIVERVGALPPPPGAQLLHTPSR